MNIAEVKTDGLERLYLETAESEHIEMYLKAMWRILEKGEEIKVVSIARILDIKQPSVVQMLHKVETECKQLLVYFQNDNTTS